MPGSQLGYFDSKERSLIIVVSGCHIIKNIQNYTHDIFSRKPILFPLSYMSTCTLLLQPILISPLISPFSYTCVQINHCFIYTPSKTQKKKKILFFLHCHYLLSDHHPLSLDYYCNIPSNLSICNL